MITTASQQCWLGVVFVSLAACGSSSNGSAERNAVDSGHAQDAETSSAVDSGRTFIDEASAPPTDASILSSVDRTLLCDGSSSIRFYAAEVGTGSRNPGSQVLSENGDFYFLIDGRCRFWSYDGSASARGKVSTGALSESDAAGLVSDFHLAEWGKWAGQYDGPSCDDGPEYVLSFAGVLLRGTHWCEPPASVPWAYSSFQEVRAHLSQAGTLADGPMRFLLVRESSESLPNSPEYRAAPRWPLAVEPASIAVSETDANAYVSGSAQLASADDAALLRSLRAGFLAGSFGFSDSAFIPIVDDQGQRFRLYARDTTTFEDAHGLLPIAW